MKELLSHRGITEGLAALGLLLIGYSVFAFDESTPFPSFYALIPTVGAGLIIIFASAQTLVGRLLSMKPFVGIGLVSYSAYLWHQPLLAFARHRSLSEPSELVIVLLVILTFPLAWMSWKFVERPFRKSDGYSRKTVFTFAVSASAVFIIIGSVGDMNSGFQDRFTVKQSIQKDFGDFGLRSNCDKNYDRSGWGRPFCELGSTTSNGKLEFAVFGDSHSEAILPAFDAAARSLGLRFAHLGLGGCIPLLGVDIAKGEFGEGVCKELAARQYEYVKSKKIKKVFFVARWALYTQGEWLDAGMKRYFLVDEHNDLLTLESSRNVFKQAMRKTIKAYRNIGADIYIVEQVPQQKISPSKLYYKMSLLGLNDKKTNDIIVTQSVLLEDSRKLQAYNRRYFEQLSLVEKINIINLDDYFCNEKICLIGDADHSFYWDDDHLSEYGAKVIVKAMSKYVR